MVTAPGIEDEMTHERGGGIERGTLEDAAIPEKVIANMTDTIVATRMTENVNLVAGPDHGREGDIVQDVGEPNEEENTS